MMFTHHCAHLQNRIENMFSLVALTLAYSVFTSTVNCILDGHHSRGSELRVTPFDYYSFSALFPSLVGLRHVKGLSSRRA